MSEETPSKNPSQDLDELVIRLRQLGEKLNDENIIDKLIAQMSCTPNFITLVRGLTKEGIAEFVADQNRDTHEVPEVRDNDHITGYVARLHTSRNENTLLRVGIHSPHHPRYPNELDVYARKNGEKDEWDNLRLCDRANEAIRDELTKVEAQPGEYYWIEMVVLSDMPINENTLSGRDIPTAIHDSAESEVREETESDHAT